MKSDWSEFELQLERATAAGQSSDVPLDPETASLREGWLALGQLLEAAQGADDPPLELRPLRRQERTAWRVAAAAALAASLVGAVTLAWNWVNTRHVGDQTPASTHWASRDSIEAKSAAQPSEPLSPGAELAWNDPLDDEIALAGQEMILVEQDWYRFDQALDAVHYGLEQMHQDLENSTL